MITGEDESGRGQFERQMVAERLAFQSAILKPTYSPISPYW
jgi:hypothetical protein